MKALLQRVTTAAVRVDGKVVGEIQQGILVFIGIQTSDSETQADRLLQRILGYRIFADANDRMNLSVQDIEGGVLLVPQFTLAADTSKGMRPSFTSSCQPNLAQKIFQHLVSSANAAYNNVATGIFGADMAVQLINDGPVTFLLET